MVLLSFHSFWEKVEQAKISFKARWKERLTCFRPISHILPRCVSRFADSAEVEPQDGKLHEDRPLLKHRPSSGFSTRQAREAVETTAQRAKGLGRRIAKKGEEATLRLRKQMSVPTPTRASRRSDISEASRDHGYDREGESFLAGTFSDDDDIFEIGSDDDEEAPFHTSPLCDDAPLNETLGAWGRPGSSPPKLATLGAGKVGKLRLTSFDSGEEVAPGTPTFYMGTPRDCI